MSFAGFIEPRSLAIHKFGSTNQRSFPRGVQSEGSVGLSAFEATIWSKSCSVPCLSQMSDSGSRSGHQSNFTSLQNQYFPPRIRNTFLSQQKNETNDLLRLNRSHHAVFPKLAALTSQLSKTKLRRFALKMRSWNKRKSLERC